MHTYKVIQRGIWDPQGVWYKLHGVTFLKTTNLHVLHLNYHNRSTRGLISLWLYKEKHIFLIGIVGGGAQLGPRPIVTAPGDYDDEEIGGMMNGRENRSIRRKPTPVPLCPPQTLHACPDANPGRRGGKSATNRLSYGTAKKTTSYGIEKNVFTLHIPPWAPRTYDFVVLTS
jgi:hypothetical protein